MCRAGATANRIHELLHIFFNFFFIGHEIEHHPFPFHVTVHPLSYPTHLTDTAIGPSAVHLSPSARTHQQMRCMTTPLCRRVFGLGRLLFSYFCGHGGQHSSHQTVSV